jgi:hypothetical protein
MSSTSAATGGKSTVAVYFKYQLPLEFVIRQGQANASVTSVFLSPALGKAGSELNAPESNRFSADSDASLCQQIFNVSVAQVEAIVEPDGAGNDVRWESVAFVCVHPSILSNETSLFVSTVSSHAIDSMIQRTDQSGTNGALQPHSRSTTGVRPY